MPASANNKTATAQDENPYASLPDVPVPDAQGSGSSEDNPYASLPDVEVDFTKGKGGTGTYKMLSPDKELKDIPYENVMPASNAGWRVNRSERERYASDRGAELWKTNPHVTEDEYVKAMKELPEAAAEKPGWWSRVEGGVQKLTEPTTKYPGIPAPKQIVPAIGEFDLNLAKRIGRVLFGIVDFAPPQLSALRDAMSKDPQIADDGMKRLYKTNPEVGVIDRVKELRDDFHRDPKLAGVNLTGDIAAMWLTGKVMEVPGQIRAGVISKYAPRPEPIAGVDVPVAVGERTPASQAGRWQTSLKRRGVNAPKWEDLNAQQQEAIKSVIRRTAARTSRMPGPIPEEPAAAVDAASVAAKNAAQPLYTRIEQSVANIPNAVNPARRVTLQALNRARWLGAVINPEDVGITEVVRDRVTNQMIDAKAIGDAEILRGIQSGKYVHVPAGNAAYVVDAATKLPVTAEELGAENIANGISAGNYMKTVTPPKMPIDSFIKVRSALRAMKRSAADPAQKFAIGGEIAAMDAAMTKALTDAGQTQLLAQWQRADRLWAKSYALEDVADGIRAATKATPAAAQAPGMTPVPTRMVGTQLVAKLNALADDGTPARPGVPAQPAVPASPGVAARPAIPAQTAIRGTPSTLEKAFTPKQIANLRQSADILDRMQRTPLGREEETGVSHSRALSRFLGMASGPAVGAVGGAVLGGWHGAEAGVLIGGLAQQFGERALVRIMTDTDGVRALNAWATAKTPAARAVAFKWLARVAVATSVGQQSSAEQLKKAKAENARLNPTKQPAPGAAPAPKPAPGKRDASASSFAQAIADAEGFGTPDAIPTLANNPGDLELGDQGHGVLQAANGQQITIFGSEQEGWDALDNQVNEIFSGKSKHYSTPMTLERFGQIYSGGDAGYGGRLAASLGVAPKATLGQVGGSGSGAGATPATGAAGGASKGSRSLGAAMALPVNKGKSEAEVEQHLRSLGYNVTRP
jgi:hypothetical protein